MGGFSPQMMTVSSGFTDSANGAITIQTTITTTPTQTISVITQIEDSQTTTSLSSLSTSSSTPTISTLATSTSESTSAAPVQTGDSRVTPDHKANGSLVPLLVGILIPVIAVAATLLWCFLRKRIKNKARDSDGKPQSQDAAQAPKAPIHPSMTTTFDSWDSQGRPNFGPHVPVAVQTLARDSPEYYPRSPLHLVPTSPEGGKQTTSSPTSNFPPLHPNPPTRSQSPEAPLRPERPVSLTPSTIESLRRPFSVGSSKANGEDADGVSTLTVARTAYSGAPVSATRTSSPSHPRPAFYRPYPPPGHVRNQTYSNRTQTPEPLSTIPRSASEPSIAEEVSFNPHPNQHRPGGMPDFNDPGRQRLQDSDESNEEEKQKKRVEAFGRLEGTVRGLVPEPRQRDRYPVSSVYSTDTNGRPRPSGQSSEDRGERGRYEVKRQRRQANPPDWDALNKDFI